MGDGKRYIPHGSFLECDKGAIPTQLQVTHHNNTAIYGEPLASEADMLPEENILPFGVCKVTGSPCKIEPIYWDKCNENTKVNGFKLVFEDSCLLCKQGGKVTVSFDTPMSILQQMAENLGDPEHWIIGLAIGNEQGMTLADKFRISAMRNQIWRDRYLANLKNSQVKGNYGEMLNRLEYRTLGYDIKNKTPVGGGNIKGTKMKPIDIIAHDPKSGMDILDETKFKSGEGLPETNKTPTKTGRQGSTKWFKARTEGSLPKNDALRVREKLTSNSPQLKNVITKAKPNGTLERYKLNPDGTTGKPVRIGAANIVKGTSKASNFINNVGRTIQANKGIATANRFITRNAHTISRVGKVVGRGAIVVGIVVDAINIGTAYQEEGKVGTKTKAAIGSAAGALAGGLAGAKIGAAIGALGGPVGIVVGGLVGGAIGAIAGSSLGESIAGWF